MRKGGRGVSGLESWAQGSRAQHGFILARLEAAWYFSECGQAQLETSWFKKGWVKCVYFTLLVLNSRVFLMFTKTRLELPGYPVQNCPYIYDNVWMGCPIRTLCIKSVRLGWLHHIEYFRYEVQYSICPSSLFTHHVLLHRGHSSETELYAGIYHGVKSPGSSLRQPVLFSRMADCSFFQFL